MVAVDKKNYPLLHRVDEPQDLTKFTSAELLLLSEEIRDYLIKSVSKTGGHLGPNLGIVELTIALHRVFHSPEDTIIWDTGHQAYVHKLLTGRKDFSSLRQEDGLSGYPARDESPHDIVENSHASTALSWADGISYQKLRDGNPGATVAVIGDGALTGGMAWEALNNIAEGPPRPLIIVVNDNGRSYAPTIGGIAHLLDAVRTSLEYEETLEKGKRRLLGFGDAGQKTYDALHGLKAGLKDVFVPQALFGDLGLKYVGPIDGHDTVAVELALERAKSFGQSVLVHVVTEKGRGYEPALEDLAERFHAVGQIHPETGLPVAPQRFGWTKVFAEEILKLADKDPSIVGITAAMMGPVGLIPFASKHPDRVIDVGIAEQHAFTTAAGMAAQGAHPVVCVYSTFMNRAFDQLLMDIALHKAPVTVVLDRAGITGDDGASHNGVWDLSLAAMVPGLNVCAPRDAKTLRKGLRKAVSRQRGPTMLRYPKGLPPSKIPAIKTIDGVDVIARFEPDDLQHPKSDKRVLIAAVGPMVSAAKQAAEDLAEDGYATWVVDPVWVLPIKPSLVDLAGGFDAVVTIEDGIVTGGFGSELDRKLGERGKSARVMGVPSGFMKHAKRDDIVRRLGLDGRGVYDTVLDVFDGISLESPLKEEGSPEAAP